MSFEETNIIRCNADMIICGYAFTKMDDASIEVVQLRPPYHALILSADGEVLETSMDDVELDIVMGYWLKNNKYIEESYA